MREIDVKVPGNTEVVDGLEKAKQRAMSGMARAVALVFCEHGGADVMYLGDVNARAQVVYGCTLLNHLLVSSTSMNVRPMEETRPANMVRYDLTGDPICYDFCPWLATAIMRMRHERAPPPLKVAFVRHPGSISSVTQAKWNFFNNVMRPMLPLFGAVEDGAAQEGRHEDFVGLKDISEFYRGGIDIPRITVPEPAMTAMSEQLDGRKPITMTLREGGSYEWRNSDLCEWDKFANWLRDKGEDVIIVRDTAKAHEPFGNFQTYPEASIDLHTRAALYESAKCNMFVTNGPWGLAYFGSKPWLMFASIDESQPEAFNRPQWWNMFMGLNEDKQLPWSGPQQRIIYEKDNFESMKTAYEGLHLA